MLRYFIILALISGAVIGPTSTANAEAIRFDLGMGATDYFSKMALPVVGPDALQLGPNFAPIEGLPEGRMAAPLILGPSDIEKLERVIALASREALRNFWTYLAILSVTFIGGSYVLGRLVIKRGWKVGYARKANALMLYFLPYIAMKGSSPYPLMVTASISLGVFILLLMLFSAPIRNRVPALATAFASIDRPEDRPFTLTWLITSVLMSWVVILAWLWFAPATVGYLFVALFISGVGDALAEPVGLYFGRHPYRTKALWTDRTYIRTLEGSATVFLSGIIAVLLVHHFEFNQQSIAALALFPIVGALAEAKSPHTWDQPFIIGSCALVAIALSYFY